MLLDSRWSFSLLKLGQDLARVGDSLARAWSKMKVKERLSGDILFNIGTSMGLLRDQDQGLWIPDRGSNQWHHQLQSPLIVTQGSLSLACGSNFLTQESSFRDSLSVPTFLPQPLSFHLYLNYYQLVEPKIHTHSPDGSDCFFPSWLGQIKVTEDFCMWIWRFWLTLFNTGRMLFWKYYCLFLFNRLTYLFWL